MWVAHCAFSVTKATSSLCHWFSKLEHTSSGRREAKKDEWMGKKCFQSIESESFSSRSHRKGKRKKSRHDDEIFFSLLLRSATFTAARIIDSLPRSPHGCHCERLVKRKKWEIDVGEERLPMNGQSLIRASFLRTYHTISLFYSPWDCRRSRSCLLLLGLCERTMRITLESRNDIKIENWISFNARSHWQLLSWSYMCNIGYSAAFEHTKGISVNVE